MELSSVGMLGIEKETASNQVEDNSVVDLKIVILFVVVITNAIFMKGINKVSMIVVVNIQVIILIIVFLIIIYRNGDLLTIVNLIVVDVDVIDNNPSNVFNYFDYRRKIINSSIDEEL